MARPTLPRFATTIALDVEVAAADERAALEAVRDLVEGHLRHVIESRVRNAGSRTARVLDVIVDPSGLGPDAMARQ